MYYSQFLLSGIISGLILCQAAVVAPLIFKTLDLEHARPLLRAIFPILFKAISITGALLLISGFFFGGWAILAVASLTIILSLCCSALIPATNRAADEGNQERFKSLHRLSVILTMIILICNLVWIFLI